MKAKISTLKWLYFSFFFVSCGKSIFIMQYILVIPLYYLMSASLERAPLLKVRKSLCAHLKNRVYIYIYICKIIAVPLFIKSIFYFISRLIFKDINAQIYKSV